MKAQPIPWIMDKNRTVTISGSCSEKMKSKALLQTPDRKFEGYDLIPGQSEVPANRRFNQSIPLMTQGTYILELNHKSGYAVMNRPLYVYESNHFPIVPDF